MPDSGRSKKKKRDKKTQAARASYSPGVPKPTHSPKDAPQDRADQPSTASELTMTNRTEQREKGKLARSRQKRFWRDYEPTEKFTLILTVFTVIYAAASVVQLYVDNSPVIGLDPGGTTLATFTEGSKVEFILGLRNAGKSPAYDLSLREVIGLEKPGERLYWEKLDGLGSGAADFLPETQYPTPVYSNFLLSRDMVYQVTSGTSLLVLMGKYRYTDTFGIPHTGQFCEISLPNEGRLAICPNKEAAELR